VRITNGDCPLNKNKGTATGGGARTEHDFVDLTKVEDWVFDKAPDQYKLVWDVDGLAKTFDTRMLENVKAIKNKAVSMSQSQVKGGASATAQLPIFLSLSKGFRTVFQWSQQQFLLKHGGELEWWEFISFLSIFAGTELINLPLEESLKMLQAYYIGERGGRAFSSSPFLSKDRYLQILTCLTAVDPDSIPADTSQWRSRTDTIPQLRKFEEEVYLQSRRMFLNAFSTLVLDDELIGLMSKTVESFAKSARKTDGKGGFKNDAVATSFLRAFVAVRHKERLGYKQDKTCQDLVREIKNATDQNGVAGAGSSRPLLTADRGYSKSWLWRFLAGEDIDFVMVCNKGATVGHPFKFKSEPAAIKEANKEIEKMQAAIEEALGEADKLAAEGTTASLGDDGGGKEGGGEEEEEEVEEEEEEDDALERVARVYDAAVEDITIDADALYEDEVDDEIRIAEDEDEDEDEELPPGIIDDDKDFGKELFSATQNIKLETGKEKVIVATAFRDYALRNKKVSNGLRFVACVDDEEQARAFKNTICMEKGNIPADVDKGKEVLFFPHNLCTPSDERKQMEDPPDFGARAPLQHHRASPAFGQRCP